MHVRETHRSRGAAQALLARLVEEARRSGLATLTLETGRSAGFAPSRRFYERAGFSPCPPFGPYASDPFSFCMSRAL